MARSINSPGVQITETDLTVNTQLIGGTTVYAMGYAAQGPTDEVLSITTISDFEQIYGIPQSPAERYFYYTCKELLNSPATLLTTRLPYGSGSGNSFDNKYTGLFFPVASSGTGFSIGQPVQISFEEESYNDILQNNVVWSTLGTSATALSIQPTLSSVSFTSATSAALFAQIQQIDPTPATYSVEYTSSTTGIFTFQVNISSVITTYGSSTPSFDGTNLNAGLVILNASQTTIDQNFQGYYIGVTDNSEFGPGSDFTSVSKLYSLSAANSFAEIPTSRLSFALSGTASSAGIGSLSEIIEGIPTYNFGDEYFKDSLIVTLFKIRSSIYEPQTLVSTIVEAHIGSLDSTKKTLADSGGIQRSFYLEDVVNNNSNNLKILVNPNISRKTNWSSLSSSNPNLDVRANSSAKALFGAGSYLPIFDTQQKLVGSTLEKIQRSLTLVESTETANIDIVVDGGLSTIYAVTSGIYDDTTYNSQSVSSVKGRWQEVFNAFNTFAQNTRKDCVFISDPLRQIFVNGEDKKILSLRNKTFTQNIYNPIKELYSSCNSNYAVTYGNWVKVYDAFSDRGAWLPFSGFAAATYARTDFNTQPWIAPAGLNRGVISSIIDIGFNPNQKQRDFLYTISINPVVFFQNDGFVIFGQKTLQNKPSAFDRVNVRRLFLSLEKAVSRSLRYFIFEPNTEFTRTRLRNSITPVFELAKNTEGLYDYLIVCDERNNTPDSIDRNELNVDIYIKPVRAAEFILVNFIATRTGQNFQELI